MKIIFLTLALLIGVDYCYSQDATPVDTASASKSEITFESLVHDYGTVKKGGNGQCEFTFKNTGKTALILTNVKASCGCTTPSWPKEPIKKGTKGVIKVKYDTNRVGPFTKSITVTTNAKNSPIRLTIKGKVEAPATTPAEAK